MKTIVCPTDASPMARNAVEYVNNLCRDMQQSMILLEKSSLQSLFLSQQQVSQEDVVGSYQEMHGAAAVSAMYENFTEPSIRQQAIHSIAGFALAEEAELIATGVEKEFSFLDVQGQPVAQLVKQAKCPALFVPEKVSYKPIQRILLVIDHEFSITRRMSFVAELARTFGAEIFLFQLNKPCDPAQNRLYYQGSVDFYLAFPYRYIHFYEADYKNTPAALHQLVASTQADLLVTVPKQETQTGNWFTDLTYSHTETKPLPVPLLAIDADCLLQVESTGYPFN